MPSSVIVAARKFLIGSLQALIDEEQALVTYAWRPDDRERNQIFTMRSEGQTPPASLKTGRTFRNEQATFVVVVHVHAVGASQDEADDQAIAFGLVIEEYVADDRCPAIDGVNWWTVEKWTLDGGPADQASVSQLLYTIRYDARLT